MQREENCDICLCRTCKRNWANINEAGQCCICDECSVITHDGLCTVCDDYEVLEGI